MFESEEYRDHARKEDAKIAEKVPEILNLFGEISSFIPPMFFKGYSWELVSDFKANQTPIRFWIRLSNRQFDISAARIARKAERMLVNDAMISEFACKLSRFTVGIEFKHLQETLKGFLCCVFGSSIVEAIHEKKGVWP